MKRDAIEVMLKSNIQLTISETLSDPEWDSFVVSSKYGHHVQTSLWAQVKCIFGWEPFRLMIKDRNEIVAGLQMLIRTYPLLGKVGYVPKGPVYLHTDAELIGSIIDKLLQECKLRNINLLVLQPPNQGDLLSDLLIERNFQRSSMELAPTASVIIDLSLDEEKIFSQIHPNTRRNIRFGLKNGIRIIDNAQDALKQFYNLHVCTSQRQNFLPYPYNYFETLQKILEPQGHFQLLFVEYDHQLVAAKLLIPFGDTVIVKMCGWSGSYEKIKPNDVLNWAAIQWAKSHGYRFLDLEGFNRETATIILQGEPFPKHLVHSPDYIKYGLGGKVVLFPEAYDYVLFSPYRWIFNKLDYHEGKHNLASKMLEQLRKR